MAHHGIATPIASLLACGLLCAPLRAQTPTAQTPTAQTPTGQTATHQPPTPWQATSPTAAPPPLPQLASALTDLAPDAISTLYLDQTAADDGTLPRALFVRYQPDAPPSGLPSAVATALAGLGDLRETGRSAASLASGRAERHSFALQTAAQQLQAELFLLVDRPQHYYIGILDAGDRGGETALLQALQPAPAAPEDDPLLRQMLIGGLIGAITGVLVARRSMRRRLQRAAE